MYQSFASPEAKVIQKESAPDAKERLGISRPVATMRAVCFFTRASPEVALAPLTGNIGRDLRYLQQRSSMNTF
jgi:hypothetical protein